MQKKKIIKGINSIYKTGEEDTKLSLFTDNRTAYTGNQKISTNQLIRMFSYF